jgi:hypothetical protein
MNKETGYEKTDTPINSTGCYWKSTNWNQGCRCIKERIKTVRRWQRSSTTGWQWRTEIFTRKGLRASRADITQSYGCVQTVLSVYAERSPTYKIILMDNHYKLLTPLSSPSWKGNRSSVKFVQKTGWPPLTESCLTTNIASYQDSWNALSVKRMFKDEQF